MCVCVCVCVLKNRNKETQSSFAFCYTNNYGLYWYFCCLYCRIIRYIYICIWIIFFTVVILTITKLLAYICTITITFNDSAYYAINFIVGQRGLHLFRFKNIYIILIDINPFLKYIHNQAYVSKISCWISKNTCVFTSLTLRNVIFFIENRESGECLNMQINRIMPSIFM